MQQLRDRLDYYVNFIREDEPQSSIERIRYVKNVYECYNIINKLFQIDYEYINPFIRRWGGYTNFILEREVKKSLNARQCTEIKELCYNKCFMCEFDLDSILNVHHIIPQRLCGKDDESNLISICPTCHAIFHKIEDNGKIPSDVEAFLKREDLHEIFTEYTKHMIDEKQAFQTIFWEDRLECLV